MTSELSRHSLATKEISAMQTVQFNAGDTILSEGQAGDTAFLRMGHRIQQGLQVILAGLDERDAVAGADMQALQRELRMLLQIERLQIATAETEKAERVLEYMLRPSFEECPSAGSRTSMRHSTRR